MNVRIDLLATRMLNVSITLDHLRANARKGLKEMASKIAKV